jgi:hypothetical protein
MDGLYCTIGPMSADQHKHIGIRRGARSFKLRGVLFSKIKTLKITGIEGPIRKN